MVCTSVPYGVQHNKTVLSYLALPTWSTLITYLFRKVTFCCWALVFQDTIWNVEMHSEFSILILKYVWNILKILAMKAIYYTAIAIYSSSQIWDVFLDQALWKAGYRHHLRTVMAKTSTVQSEDVSVSWAIPLCVDEGRQVLKFGFKSNHQRLI